MAGSLVAGKARQLATEWDVRFASTSELGDATSIADGLLSEAVAFCERRMGIGSTEAVIALLGQNDKTACAYFFYGLAKSAAWFLGRMDEHVKAVYIHDYDATPEDICFGTLYQGVPLIHLIVWTQRKTAALDSLIAVLDRALTLGFAGLIGNPQIRSLLDAQLIDNADVEKHIGHGALLQAVHHRPIQVWAR